MSNADWWANKFAAQRQSTPPPTPRHTSPLQLPTYPQHQPQPPAPQHQAPQVAGEFDGKSVSYMDVAREHDGQKITRLWKGGEAMRKEGHLTCPNCGSMHVFTRDSINLMNTQTGVTGTAKPRCFECGWSQNSSTGTEFTPGNASNWGIAS